MNERICGLEWGDIQRAQAGGKLHRTVKIDPNTDYGYDHVADRPGFVRMVPSGNVMPLAEAVAILSR